jgi:hypothetical protein
LTLTYITLNIADNHWQFHFHFNSWDCHWLFFELSSILRPLTFSLFIIYRYILLSFHFHSLSCHWHFHFHSHAISHRLADWYFIAFDIDYWCWFNIFRLLHLFSFSSFLRAFISFRHYASFHFQLDYYWHWYLLIIDCYWYFHSLHWYFIISHFHYWYFWLRHYFHYYLLIIDYFIISLIIYYIIIISLLTLIFHYYITLIFADIIASHFISLADYLIFSPLKLDISWSQLLFSFGWLEWLHRSRLNFQAISHLLIITLLFSLFHTLILIISSSFHYSLISAIFGHWYFHWYFIFIDITPLAISFHNSWYWLFIDIHYIEYIYILYYWYWLLITLMLSHYWLFH